MSKVLVIGSGGREHTLCETLKKDSEVDRVFCAPGNGGTERSEGIENLEYGDFDRLYRRIKKIGIDLVVVGPEKPLARGLGDYLRSKSLNVVGFNRSGARLESSKVFADRFKDRMGVACPHFKVFSNFDRARGYINERLNLTPDLTLWVKADELCGGKGAISVDSLREGETALRDLLVKKKCGKGQRVVVQDGIGGEEATIQALTDGKEVFVLPSSQDHKAAYEGGKGPNTGGMGAYSPAPLVDRKVEKYFQKEILKPTLRGVEAEKLGSPGVLYFGLMVDKQSRSRLLEYNVRFGDPEAQAVLPLLQCDFFSVLQACAQGDLSSVVDEIRIREGATVCVILAVEGYPQQYGDEFLPVEGIDHAEEIEGVKVYHAGTKWKDGNFYTDGGRVLGVSGYGKDLSVARSRAYKAVERIHFQDMRYRKDIADQVS